MPLDFGGSILQPPHPASYAYGMDDSQQEVIKTYTLQLLNEQFFTANQMPMAPR